MTLFELTAADLESRRPPVNQKVWTNSEPKPPVFTQKVEF
jgi:hypothetical protein